MRNYENVIGSIILLIAATTARSAVVRTVALTRELTVGLPSDASVFNFHWPVLSANGHTAFHAGLDGSGVDVTNNSGIWHEGSDGLQLIARKGSQAPGMPVGVRYVDFHVPLATNSVGQLAFLASTAQAEQGVWSNGPNRYARSRRALRRQI
jgi:hypothetical protein